MAAMVTLMRLGWGQENSRRPARCSTAAVFAPDATREQADWFNNLQRILVRHRDRGAYVRGQRRETDVTEFLGKITAPTLVMHSRE